MSHHHSLLRVSSAVVALALVGAPSAFAQDITVEHAQGETTLTGTPAKVFTYDMATLDTLDALGIEVQGIPDANLPNHLQDYADTLKIGSLFEPDYELVAAEQPDVVFVAGRSSSVYPNLSEIAPTVDLSVDWTDFPGTIKERSRTVGEIFGEQEAVDQLIAELDGDIATVQEHAPTVGNALIVITAGGRVTAFGPGSRFGWLHDDLNIVPAIEDVEAATHGEAVSFEFLLETDPDWLLVIDRDTSVGEASQSAQQILDNELVHEMSAWQNDQVVYLDPVNFYIVNGGLNTLHTMVREVGTAIGADLR
ncbi:siderophore ABC transporter substrate-binding protein [Pelagibacterium montanilacus]|uniref:siderophore ABC transporter substrate-binding protein n=1 Tax=Pelagibacterium montanilacus TaxID=2185280 RepID=UPI0019D16B26|nr:siderophore ABC transporter substrate-binding protein [Pelagibacterium montanilacus]